MVPNRTGAYGLDSETWDFTNSIRANAGGGRDLLSFVHDRQSRAA
jgi:hypothetical protein